MSQHPSWRMSFARLQFQLMSRRRQLRITQVDASFRLGVSRSTFQRWERGGDEVPNAYQLFRWAWLLGIEITSDLMTESVNSDASSIPRHDLTHAATPSLPSAEHAEARCTFHGNSAGVGFQAVEGAR